MNELPNTLEELQKHARFWVDAQRQCMWAIGDIARKAESMSTDALHQVFPEDASPGLIARCKAVSLAYPRHEDRNPMCTWTQHMGVANKPNRKELLEGFVTQGLTSDESRKAAKDSVEARTEKGQTERRLLAFDIHYFAHRHYYSGAGVETAMRVSEWVKRTVDRLRDKGITDVLCAFEGHGSFRRELTHGEEWAEHRYKDRPPKPDDLKHQLQLVRELLDGFGFCCVSVDGYEADDVLASAAKQFQGKTIIVSSDKDLRQCLSEKCNILLDVQWVSDETTGEMVPDYQWLTAKTHTETTGILPEQWAGLQILMGDSVDGIQGAAGIGETGAKSLIQTFGTPEAAIQAAKDGDERIKEKKRESLIEFEGRLEVTRKLVVLVDSLPIPNNTRV